MRLRWLQPLHNGPHRLHSWEEVVVMVQKWPTPVLHRLRKIISNGFLACDVGLTHILVDFYRIYNPLNSSWQLTLTSAQLIQQDSKVEIWFLICFVAKTKKLDNDLRTLTSKAVLEYAEGMNRQVHFVFISIPDDMIDSFSVKMQAPAKSFSILFSITNFINAFLTKNEAWRIVVGFIVMEVRDVP